MKTLSFAEFKSLKNHVVKLSPAQVALKQRARVVERKFQGGKQFFVDQNGMPVDCLQFSDLVTWGYYRRTGKNQWTRNNEGFARKVQEKNALFALAA